MSPSRRPLGVALLALWAVVVGVGVTALAVYAVYGIRTIPEGLAAFQRNPEALVGIAAAVSTVNFVMAAGLWTLRPWARPLAIGFSVLALVVGMFTLPVGLASVLLSAASVWYLNDHRTRAVFREAT